MGKIRVYGRGCLQEDIAHGGPAEYNFLRTFRGEKVTAIMINAQPLLLSLMFLYAKKMNVLGEG